MKALVFDNIYEAQLRNREEALLRGLDNSSYWWEMLKLNDITTADKATMANILGIYPYIYGGDDGNTEIENPEYAALPEETAVHKYALIVGDDLNTYDDENNVIVPENVIEITDDMRWSAGDV